MDSRGGMYIAGDGVDSNGGVCISGVGIMGVGIFVSRFICTSHSKFISFFMIYLVILQCSRVVYS